MFPLSTSTRVIAASHDFANDPAPQNGVSGPIAATISDLELAYRIMATPDPQDPVSINFPQPTKPPVEAHTGKRIIGIYKPWFEDCDQEVKDATSAAVKWLETEAGYEVVDIEIPYLKEGRTAHAITIMTEIGQGFCKGDASGLTPANKVLVGVSNKTPARVFPPSSSTAPVPATATTILTCAKGF